VEAVHILRDQAGCEPCLGCGAVSARAELQALLRADHPWLAAEVAAAVADGDAAFEPPGQAELGEVCCARCSGLLKPHVVFFGENVPRERVADAMAVLDRARALVVLGSSLTVYSGLRFVHRAKALGLPVAIVTRGPTRGDADAVLKLEASVGPVVEALVERLVEAPAGTAQRAIGAARELCGAGEGR